MSQSEFLYWIADRLVFVYGESLNADFVTRLRAIAYWLEVEERRAPRPA